MENKPFKEMPEAPVPPRLPKYFPDLQGANRGKTPGEGWIENELKPWVRQVNSNYGYGIWISLSMVTALGLGIGIYDDAAIAFTAQTKDKILEVSRKAKDQILGLLTSLREKIVGLPTPTPNLLNVNSLSIGPYNLGCTTNGNGR